MAGVLAIDELRRHLVSRTLVVAAAQRLVDALKNELTEQGFMELPSFGFYSSQVIVSKQAWFNNSARQYLLDPATDSVLVLQVQMGAGWNPTLGSDVLTQRVTLGAPDESGAPVSHFECFELPLPKPWSEVLIPGDLLASAGVMAQALSKLPGFCPPELVTLSKALLTADVQAAIP